MDAHLWWALLGIPVIVLGFALRLNPLLVVVAAGLLTGLAVGLSFDDVLMIFGEKLMNSRQLGSTLLILPVIALLEKFGLKEHAQAWVRQIRGATAGRILMLYFILRQFSSALGLTNLGGQAQTVRPLIAPMVQAVASEQYGELSLALREKIAALAAASDNVALFFGEDIFIAFGAVLLMLGVLQEHGITQIEALTLGLWAIPTALSAMAIHLFRLSLLDRQIRLAIKAEQGANT